MLMENLFKYNKKFQKSLKNKNLNIKFVYVNNNLVIYADEKFI